MIFEADVYSLDFSSDGRAFYGCKVSADGATLLRIDMEGRTQVLWRFKGAEYSWALPSPDGRYLATTYPLNNRNLWMLEGF